jgi:hypothetical protein
VAAVCSGSLPFHASASDDEAEEWADVAVAAEASTKERDRTVATFMMTAAKLASRT